MKLQLQRSIQLKPSSFLSVQSLSLKKGGIRGIWAESAKTLMFNNSVLRGKTPFKVINENARYKNQSNSIKPEKMNFGLDLAQRRQKKRTLVLSLIIYPISVMAFLLWLYSTYLLG